MVEVANLKYVHRFFIEFTLIREMIAAEQEAE